MPDLKLFPLKLFLIKYELDIVCLKYRKIIIFHCGFPTKVTCVFLLPYYSSDKCFKGTVVNRALLPSHGGPLEITLSVLLIHLRRQTAFWKYQKNVFVYTITLESTVNFTKFYPQLFISTYSAIKKKNIFIRWKRKAKTCYRSVGAKYELRRTF